MSFLLIVGILITVLLFGSALFYPLKNILLWLFLEAVPAVSNWLVNTVASLIIFLLVMGGNLIEPLLPDYKEENKREQAYLRAFFLCVEFFAACAISLGWSYVIYGSYQLKEVIHNGFSIVGGLVLAAIISQILFLLFIRDRRGDTYAWKYLAHIKGWNLG